MSVSPMDEVPPVEFQLKFKYPDGKGTMSNEQYERRSKEIDPETALYQYLITLRNIIIQLFDDTEYEKDPLWIPQMELLTLREHLNAELLQRRTDKMHLTDIDVLDLGYIKNKLVIFVDPIKIESYGPLHFSLLTVRGTKKPTVKELNDVYLEFQAGGTFAKVV
jgi:hypothetical protein